MSHISLVTVQGLRNDCKALMVDDTIVVRTPLNQEHQTWQIVDAAHNLGALEGNEYHQFTLPHPDIEFDFYSPDPNYDQKFWSAVTDRVKSEIYKTAISKSLKKKKPTAVELDR
jgi:hypothetical protein